MDGGFGLHLPVDNLALEPGHGQGVVVMVTWGGEEEMVQEKQPVLYLQCTECCEEYRFKFDDLSYLVQYGNISCVTCGVEIETPDIDLLVRRD